MPGAHLSDQHPAAVIDRITVQSILTLYKQVPNSFVAAITVTAFMAFTPGPY